MRRADIVGGLIFLALGIGIISQSLPLGYWGHMGPGPGFVPLWSGVAVALAGLLLSIQSFRSRDAGEDGESSGKVSGIPAIVLVVAVLTILAAFAMDILGFVLSMFLLLAVLIGLSRRHRLSVTLGVAAAVTAVFFLVFEWGLQVPLPKGVFGL